MEQRKAGENMGETCPKCNSLLRIGSSYMTFENDDTPEKPTIAYVNLPLLCVNKECENFAGENLTNPRYLTDLVRNQVN
jgi:hypothetical protein